jgi:hypothetical protein
VGSAFVVEPSVGNVFAEVSEPYRTMQTFFDRSRNSRGCWRPAGGSVRNENSVTVGRRGAFRVETKESGIAQVRVSDGKITAYSEDLVEAGGRAAGGR